jgi:hypothetical protein
VGEDAVGVQDEARAVEDLVVLPAQEVEVDQRQPRFDHAGHHLGLPDIHLAPVVGGAVGHQQDLGPRFGQCLGHVLEPRVLADRHPDTNRADAHGARRVARVVIPLLVEDVVIRQVVFQDRGRNLAVLQDVVGVEGLRAAGQRAADADGRAIRAGRRQLPHHAVHIHREGRLLDQVLKLVAGQEHLGKRDHVGARIARLGPSGTGGVGIGGQVADRGIELRQPQAKLLGHGACTTFPFRGVCPRRP